MPKKENFEVSLGVLECEVFTISPIRVSQLYYIFSIQLLVLSFCKVDWNSGKLQQVFGSYIQLSPIGLLDMYNSGGAIESLHFKNKLSECVVKVRIRGCGRFGAYSNKKPRSCMVDKKEEFIVYNANNGLLLLKLHGQCSVREIDIAYWVLRLQVCSSWGALNFVWSNLSVMYLT